LETEGGLEFDIYDVQGWIQKFYDPDKSEDSYRKKYRIELVDAGDWDRVGGDTINFDGLSLIF